jgi:hypothetical protein
MVVVQGCSHPTVAGAGFDVGETAAVITRMCVATLAPEGEDGPGYPDLPYNYIALSFRRQPDDAEYPRMAAHDLPPADGTCEQCRLAAGSTAELSSS